MNLFDWLTDPRTQLGGALVVVLIVVSLALDAFDGGIERKLQQLIAEHQGLRRMILDTCGE